MEAVTDQVVPLTAQFIKTRASGPVPARVLIVGEAPGAEEEVRGVPFVGASGNELDRLLAQAGLQRSEAFLTNVCKYRPPENKIEYFFLDSKQLKPNELILEGIRELQEEISRVSPKLILCLGNTALWALTGNRGITKWRGSMLTYRYLDSKGVQQESLLLPTYHPALILREWSWRPIALHDLTRAAEALKAGHWPGREKHYLIRPSFTDVMDTLTTLVKRADRAEQQEDPPLTIASDLETRRGFIACSGIAWSKTEAICIPNMCVERPTGYFTLDEDISIWFLERELLTHPHVEVVGQNYLYDAQYFARRKGYVPRVRHDTRLMQSVAWPGLPQGLDFLSSMYCQHHVFWKDEGKEWDPKKDPEDNYWAYNCTDSTSTFEVWLALQRALYVLRLYSQYRFQMRLWWSCLRMMLRGVRIDRTLRDTLAQQLMAASQERQNTLTQILGRELNVQSPKQMMHLFYGELQCKVVKHKKTKRPTCDEDALKTFAYKEPLLRPIVEPIVEMRSIDSLLSNVVLAKAPDGRMRTQFSPTASSLRWTSSKDAWNEGTNLQNWTKGDEDE